MNLKNWWLQGLKYLLLMSLIIPLLTACSVSDTVKEQYPLESVNGSGNETSYVYRAVDQTVAEVAAELIEKRKPEQQSAESTERMFLVYSNEIIHLQQASDNKEDTIIEVDSKEYVRRNYSSGFLQGYLLSSVIGNLFDNGRSTGSYRGYSSKDDYKPESKYRIPTAADKKIAPPMTVNRSGSIFKRSKNSINSTDSTSSKDPITGKIIRDKDNKSQTDNLFKKSKTTKPRVKVGRSRISRRRR
ncbi:MAG: DUF4247 domain-containing protein [Gorillibacterium sp.]|nr:DUF4247 domain-containing protein [Gorillibacterium sp.]